MTEDELREALERDKIVRLYPERAPIASNPKAEALMLIDRAVHSARTAGFELVGPCEVGPERIAGALEQAREDLAAAIALVAKIEEVLS